MIFSENRGSHFSGSAAVNIPPIPAGLGRIKSKVLLHVCVSGRGAAPQARSRASCAPYGDAPQTRDRRKMPSLKRSRLSGAPFHAAPRPGNGNLKLVAMSPQRERDELSFVSPQVAAE